MLCTGNQIKFAIVSPALQNVGAAKHSEHVFRSCMFCCSGDVLAIMGTCFLLVGASVAKWGLGPNYCLLKKNGHQKKQLSS